MLKSDAKRGFTLIELLIVIAIIGVLAAGILIIINPLGQLKKARDAQRKSALAQVRNALDAYAVFNGKYPIGRFFSPWNKNTWGLGAPGTCAASVFCNALVNGGELKALPFDPVNKEGGPGNYLGDNAPTDQGYVYDSVDGSSYTLGTNLEADLGTANNLGNYRITGP